MISCKGQRASIAAYKACAPHGKGLAGEGGCNTGVECQGGGGDKLRGLAQVGAAAGEEYAVELGEQGSCARVTKRPRECAQFQYIAWWAPKSFWDWVKCTGTTRPPALSMYLTYDAAM